MQSVWRGSLYLALALLFSWGQAQTRVSVKRGLVNVGDGNDSTYAGAGQQAMMDGRGQAVVTPDSPLVQALLPLRLLIQDERQQGDLRLDETAVQVVALDSDTLWRAAVLVSAPNSSDQANTTFKMGPTYTPANVAFYDLQGRRLTCRRESADRGANYLYLTFSQAVAPGDLYEFIMITEVNPQNMGVKIMWLDNGQWHARMANDTAYCLNFYHFILPPSAILTDSSLDPFEVGQTDERVAVTLRNYTGSEADGSVVVSFLWPEHDGPSAQGLPWKEAGLEALEVYQAFLEGKVQSQSAWGELAIKLVGGGFYDEAKEAFEQCEALGKQDLWTFAAMVWQGHLCDLQDQRDVAVAHYQAALALEYDGYMRHDQWRMVLNRQWVKDRLVVPFKESFVRPPLSLEALQKKVNALSWQDTGETVASLYQECVSRIDSNSEAYTGTVDRLWFILGLKLVPTGQWEQALDCFQRCTPYGNTGYIYPASIVWQGHCLDVLGRLVESKQCYQKVLDLAEQRGMTDQWKKIIVRHDQWKMVIDLEWVQQRLQVPFNQDLLVQD